MSERKWEIVKSAVYNNIFADTLFRPIVSDFKLLSILDNQVSIEKSEKYLEKYRATQGRLRTIIANKKELNDSQQINGALYNFYQTLFK